MIDRNNFKKHAYLIMCHDNFSVLEKLIRLLDHEKNDIYIHVDKKVKNFDKTKFLNICRYSNVFFTDKRYNIKWAGARLSLTEVYLFKYAYLHNKNGYSYYHLISGTDLPLKNQDYIHEFFDNRDNIFLNSDDDIFVERKYWRIAFYHSYNYKINKFLVNLQRKLKTDRIKKYKMKFYTGSEWCSLPEYAVEYLLKKQKFIKKICRFSFASDECYKQFIIYNSPLAEKIYRNEDGVPDHLRLIFFSRSNNPGHPHIFDMSDKELLTNSPKLFARKFDEKVCPEIIDYIYQLVSQS